MIEFTCENPCLIRRVSEDFGCLSNMSAHPVDWPTSDGAVTRWPRAEQLFQALRFSPGHPLQLMLIAESNPMRAKMMVKPRLGEATVQPRSEQDLTNMRAILLAKAQQHAVVRDCLRRSLGRAIVEDCGRRASGSGLFWGAARVTGRQHDWRGQNVLGALWMSVREELHGGSA